MKNKYRSIHDPLEGDLNMENDMIILSVYEYKLQIPVSTYQQLTSEQTAEHLKQLVDCFKEICISRYHKHIN